MNTSLLLVDLLTRLNTLTVIIGMIVAVVGISLVFLAKRLTRAFKRTDDVADNDKLYTALKIIGLVFILAGLILVAIP